MTANGKVNVEVFRKQTRHGVVMLLLIAKALSRDNKVETETV
jgi:hypothetical protein